MQKPKRAEPLRAAVAADLNGAARSSGSQAESYSTIISYCMIQCEFGAESFCLTATRLDCGLNYVHIDLYHAGLSSQIDHGARLRLRWA